MSKKTILIEFDGETDVDLVQLLRDALGEFVAARGGAGAGGMEAHYVETRYVEQSAAARKVKLAEVRERVMVARAACVSLVRFEIMEAIVLHGSKMIGRCEGPIHGHLCSALRGGEPGLLKEKWCHYCLFLEALGRLGPISGNGGLL